MRNKDFEKIRLKIGKLRLGVFLFILLGLCILIRLTPATQYYWINWLTAFVVSNAISLCVIGGLLIGLHFVELKRYEERLESEDEENVH